MYRIRPLGVADAECYRRIRLDALRLHPEAFAASYEDEAKLDSGEIVERLTTPGVTRFGGFSGRDLVGLVGLHIGTGTKARHTAELFSMYVDAAHRRSGLARQLVDTVIAGAREAGAVVLRLSVTVGNASAQRCYRGAGFTVYGVERRGLRIGDRYYDQELMALDLD